MEQYTDEHKNQPISFAHNIKGAAVEFMDQRLHNQRLYTGDLGITGPGFEIRLNINPGQNCKEICLLDKDSNEKVFMSIDTRASIRKNKAPTLNASPSLSERHSNAMELQYANN